MKTVDLGQSGLKVTELGCGGIPIKIPVAALQPRPARRHVKGGGILGGAVCRVRRMCGEMPL